MGQLIDRYNEFLTIREYTNPEDRSEKEKRLIFLVDEILDLTTYCEDYSLEIGEKILDIMKFIYVKQKVVENIKPKFNYYKEDLEFDYIVYVQFIIQFLNWGTSIYSAWFDSSKEIEGYRLTSDNINYLINWFDNN